MLFSQIRNRAGARAATWRLVFGAVVAILAWVLLCVCCFVEISGLPSSAEAPRCPCDSVQLPLQLPRETRQDLALE